MKKNTIYTMLCTTILAPGIALGAENEKKMVPETPTKVIREQIATMPETPKLEQIIQEKYPPNIFSPETGTFLADLHRSKISSANALEREKLEQQVAALNFKKRMEKLEAEEELKRLALIEAAKQELTESEKRSQELDEQMKNAALRAQKAEQYLEDLTLQLQSLKEEAEKEKLAIKQEAELESKAMQLQLEQAQTTAERERTQKIMVKQSAADDLEIKNKRIKQVEALVAERQKEIEDLRIDYRKLELEKERMAQAHAIKTGSKISEVPSEKKLFADIYQQQDPMLTTVESGGSGSTDTNKKRAPKAKTETKF